MLTESEYIEMCEPDRPLRLSASVYMNGSQIMLVEPQHCFEDGKEERSAFIRSTYQLIKSAAAGLKLDRFISTLSGNQHVLQLNFTKG